MVVYTLRCAILYTFNDIFFSFFGVLNLDFFSVKCLEGVWFE